MNGIQEKSEQEEIREMISIMRIIPKPSRAILLANANAFKVLEEVKRGNGEPELSEQRIIAEGMALAREMDRETGVMAEGMG